MYLVKEIDETIYKTFEAVEKPIDRKTYRVIDRGVPHQPKSLPPGMMGVYMFAIQGGIAEFHCIFTEFLIILPSIMSGIVTQTLIEDFGYSASPNYTGNKRKLPGCQPKAPPGS